MRRASSVEEDRGSLEEQQPEVRLWGYLGPKSMSNSSRFTGFGPSSYLLFGGLGSDELIGVFSVR